MAQHSRRGNVTFDGLPALEAARHPGLHPLALFDDSRAGAVHPLAFAQGLRIAEELTTDRNRTGPAAA